MKRTSVECSSKEKMMELYEKLIQDPQRQAFNFACEEYGIYVVAYNTKGDLYLGDN